MAPQGITRRRALAISLQAALAAGILACAPGAARETPGAAAPGTPVELTKVELGFCGQVLCVLPFEVAVKQGFFRDEGLDVNLSYMRGGAVAIQALTSGSLDVAGSALDVVVQANAQGRQITYVAGTARVPFFALLAAPKTASAISRAQDLSGKKLGVANLNTSDHILARYFLVRAGVNVDQVEFVPVGTNLYDFLLRGEVDAGLVQDPSRTLLLRQGARELVNFMSVKDSEQHLGGPYQFMGLSTRPDVIESNPELIRKLVKGLVRGSRWILEQPGSEVVKVAPGDIIAGNDGAVFAEVLDQFKADLYPSRGLIDEAAVQRVIDVQASAGAIPAGRLRARDIFTNQFAEGV